jgi:acetylornithine deacetylase/succinyl-diaminopimelate desuccinylase family protein
MKDDAVTKALGSEEEKVLATIDQDETLELLRELIRIPSENPPGHELEKARYLQEFFARNGLEAKLEEVEPGRPNVIAEFGAGSGPLLVLCGHIDTVPAGEGWTFDPFGAEIADGRVYGRGACDMLAGVASMCAAALAVKRSGVALGGRIAIHAVIDEEVDALGSQKAAQGVDADWVIVTESSAGRVETYTKGQLNVEIAFRGKAAHSSTPELGRNAIHDAAAFAMLVEAENERVADEQYPGVGPATYAVTIIDGGTNGSIIPAGCKLTLDRRLLPTETIEDAEADVRRLLDELREQRSGLDAEMRPTLVFPPLPPSVDGEVAGAIKAARQTLYGVDTEFSGATGVTDASWYGARGMEAVVYGPGSCSTAHQPDEFIAIDEVHETTRVLALAATRLLAAG